MIVLAVEALVTALAIDYRPLVRAANLQLLAAPGAGLPAGPYHPQFGQDGEEFY